jgi:ABC-type multidrug transport system fused ATPase/permease subunit
VRASCARRQSPERRAYPLGPAEAERYAKPCISLGALPISFAKGQLLLALVTVALGVLLAALSPIVLTLVDALGDSGAATYVLVTPLTLVLYVVRQYLFRSSSELRAMLHGHAEQRIRRHVSRRLFEHLVRMPLRFHLERKVGALRETVKQGLRGFGLLLQHLVYTVVPLTIEFGTVAIVLNGLIVATIFGLSLSVSLTYGLRDVTRGTMTVGETGQPN